ncbi:hypothetical protein [Sorangium sp. So ce131]|uniref:hypothetical protein n=1 Tax=Sorangium sp. So ce131 TaxID=3133282 RepID=UPI003F60A4BA
MKKADYVRIASFIPFVCTGVINLAAGCSGAATDEKVGAAESALTPGQCEYFDVNGTVRICHKTNSTTHPYTVLKLSEQACINAHAQHAGDYVAVNDPTCQGGACLPLNAPCDATLPCCSGATCTNGTCVSTCTPTTCEAQGASCGTISDGCGDTLVCDACTNAGGTCGLDDTCTCPDPEGYDPDCVENVWDAAEQECELSFLSSDTVCSVGQCDGNGHCVFPPTFPPTLAPTEMP